MLEEITFDVDVNNLEKELSRGGKDIQYFGQKDAEYVRSIKQLKTEIEIRKAELIIEVSKNPQDFDLPEKPTAPMKDATVTKHPDIIELYQKLYKVEYDQNINKAAIRGIEQKNYAMKDLVTIIVKDIRTDYDPLRNVNSNAIQESVENRRRNKDV